MATRVARPADGYAGDWLSQSASPDVYAQNIRAFRLGLNETGYVEGQNVAIEYRWAENQYDRLPALATELVRQRVTVITTGRNTQAALAAKAATTTIPIVFLLGGDPVQLGLVGSLNRPSGNLTGVTTLNVEITPKRLQVLRELLPTTPMMAILVNPINNPAVVENELRQAQETARTPWAADGSRSSNEQRTRLE